MPEPRRFLPAGPGNILVELEDLAATLSLMEQISAQNWPEVTDLIPAARTLMVSFDPGLAGRDALIDRIAAFDLSHQRGDSGRRLRIPVLYDGEDLLLVAGMLGLTESELIDRHRSARFTVAFQGFAPGFAYMTCDDPLFNVPRRPSPRLRIPAGAVALAGCFGGIYPSESPGGWQIIGRTPLRMWDAQREKPALLTPGDQVSFKAISAEDFAAWPREDEASPPPPQRHMTVLRADFPAYYQDLGREGMAGQGIARSGAMDRSSLIAANRSLGNPRDAAVLEIPGGGFSLRAEDPVTLALTGAEGALRLETAKGEILSPCHGAPFALDAGDVLRIGHAQRGVRAYLAVRGGFVAGKTLGSVARDTLAKLGPPPVRAGDALERGEAPPHAVTGFTPRPAALPARHDVITLKVHLGPRTDWFTPESIQTFLTQDWEISAEADRVGYRLQGALPLARAISGELPSEATPSGALQVPKTGQPVLFLADHPLTGGYPVIAVLDPADLDLAGQAPIGARLRFRAVSGFTPVIREAS